MQKRKARSSNNMQLPLTTSDLSNHRRSSSKNQYRSHNKYTSSSLNQSSRGTTFLTCFLFLIVIFLVGFLLKTDFHFDSNPLPPPPITKSKKTYSDAATSTDAGSSSSSSSSGNTLNDSNSLATKFKSLEYPLSNSKLVGLYFASSWCPMSTSVTNSLEEIFSQTTSVNEPTSSNRLLTKEDNIKNGQEQQKQQQQQQQQQQEQQQKDFALVYVSSDTSADEMKDYMKWNWIDIPYDSPDRNELKRYFKTCAQNEMEELGIEARRFEIPSLFIVDSVTQDIISTNGVGDLQDYGEEVLDHWLEIQSLMRALEDKYV